MRNKKSTDAEQKTSNRKIKMLKKCKIIKNLLDNRVLFSYNENYDANLCVKQNY